MAIDWDKIEKQVGKTGGINWLSIEKQTPKKPKVETKIETKVEPEVKPRKLSTFGSVLDDYNMSRGQLGKLYAGTLTNEQKAERLERLIEEPTERPDGVLGLFDDAFSHESYVDKFKRGDIKGGVANVVGSTLLAPQSAYLNALDAIHAIAHGEKPTFKHNFSGLDYQRSIAERTGGKTISEQLHEIHPLVGTLGDLAYEIGTDPLELTPLGFYKDIQRVKAGGELSAGYMEAMMKGKLTPKQIADVTMSKDMRRGLKGEITRRPLRTDKAKAESIFTDYYPEYRAKDVVKSSDYHSVSVELGVDPDEMVTIYRGSPEGKLNNGDWVTTSEQLAKDYAGSGKVVKEQVPAKHLYAPKGEGVAETGSKVPVGESMAKTGDILEPKVKPAGGVQSPQVFVGGGRKGTVVRRMLAQADGEILHTPPKTGKTVPEKMKRVFKDFRHNFEDDNILAMYEELRATGVKDLSSADQSLYKTMRLEAGAPAKADYRIQQYLAPALDEYRKSGGKINDLSKYATAVHAQDVNKAGIKSGLSNRQIAEYISKYGTPEAEKARQALVKYSDDMIQDLYEAGRITQESLDGMRNKWPNYVPLQRDLGEDVALSMIRGDGTPIHELKGSKKPIIDPIQSMLRNTYKIEAEIAKGDIDKQLIALAKKDVTGGDVVRKLGKGESTDYKNVIKVMDNGKEVDYVVSNDLYRALTDFDKETNSWLVNTLAKPAGILRAGAVLNPEFALRNPIRDVLQAFINSESGFNPLTDFISGIYSYTKKDKHFHDFVKSGGAFGTVVDVDRVAWLDMQRRVLSEKGVAGKFINVITPDQIMDLLRQMTEYSEMGTRMGEFKKAVKSGVSTKEAAFRARDLQDFSRVGKNIRTPNRMVAFLNAEIQGISKFARALHRDPVRTSARAFILLAGTSTATYAYNHYFANDKQKRTISDAPRWLRDTFWLIAIPGTDTVARIPKPFEGSFISNIVENTYDYLSGNNPEAFNEYFDEMKDNASIPSLISTFGPTGLLPVYEIASNKNYFRNAPVVSQSYQNLPKREQKDYRTSSVAKGISAVASKVDENWFLASPMEVDHMIRGYTAGLGQYVTGPVDIIVGAINPESDVRAAPHWSQLPIAKGFTVNPYSTGKSSDKIYTESEYLSKERQVRDLDVEEQGRYSFLNDVKKDLSEINKEIRQVQNNPYLDKKAKRDRLLRLTNKRDDLAYDSARKIEQIEKATIQMSRRYDDPDIVHREVNKMVFGAEYALKKYNKTTYEKAKASGLPYGDYYKAYFAQKDKKTDLEKVYALYEAGMKDEKTLKAMGINTEAKEGYVPMTSKVQELIARNISASDYIKAKEASDENGNGNISKTEAINYLETTNLSREQKRAMLQALVPNLKTINNPY